MLVKALMVPIDKLDTVKSEDSIRLALNLMNEKELLSIPVVDGKNFKGVISKERIFKEYFETGGDKNFYLDNNKVRDFTRIDIPHVLSSESIESAAFILEINGVPFVAIKNNLDEIEGIVTHHIIFKAFTEILGLDKGKKLSILTYNTPGQVSKIADIIKKYEGDIISLVVMDPKAKLDVREITVRVRTENFDKIVLAVKEAGFRVE